jgi:hypothetical protein
MNYISKNWRILVSCIILILGATIIYFYTTKEEEFEFKISGNYYKDYEINEVIPVYVTDEDVAKRYLAEFVNLVIYYPDKVYEILADEDKEKYQDYEEFKKYLDSLINDLFVKASVKKYAITTSNNKRCIMVVDADGNTITFIENSIMNYNVSIN